MEEFKEKGNAAYKAKNYDEAIKFYSEGLKVDPYSHILFSNRSASYAAKGEHEKSLKDAEKSIQINPRWLKGWLRKAQAHEKMKDFEAAMQAYKKARDIDPKDTTIMGAMMECSGRMMFGELDLKENIKHNKNFSYEGEDADVMKHDHDKYDHLNTKQVVQEIKRLLDSKERVDHYDAAFLVDSRMIKDAEKMVKEFENNTEIFPKLVAVASQSYSGTEYKVTEDRATIGLTAIAMMQAKMSSKRVDPAILKGMVQILKLDKPKQNLTVVNALSIITMYDHDNMFSSPLCTQVINAGFIDMLVQLMRQDNPPDMKTVFTACTVLSRLCKSKNGRKEILSKGGLEAVTKVVTTKVTGLENNVSFGAMDTILTSSGMPGLLDNTQDSAIDAMIEMGFNFNERTHDKDVVLQIVRLGGVKALINSITVPTIFGRILTGARFLGTIANILNVEEPQYRKLFCRQIELPQLMKLLTIGDNPNSNDFRLMFTGNGKTQESQLHAIKANICQVIATVASNSDNAQYEVVNSGMLGYIIEMAKESNGAMNAISVLVKHPEIAQIVFAHKEFAESIKHIPYEEDETEWNYAITYTLQTLQYLTAYEDYCIAYMSLEHIVDCLIRHSHRAERRDAVAKIIENFGAVALSTKGQNGMLRQFNKVMNKNMPANVRKSIEATVQAIKTGIPNPNVVKPQPPVKTKSTVNKVKMCGLPSCDKVEKEGTKFKKCGKCLEVAYCSAECQKIHWKIHRPVCVPKVNSVAK